MKCFSADDACAKTTQSFRLSTNARARAFTRALAEPRLDKRQRAEVAAGSVETQRGAGKGRHNGRKSVGKMMQNEKCHFYGL